MKPCARYIAAPLTLAFLAGSGGAGVAGDAALEGVKDIALHTRDGKTLVIGTVAFTRQGDGATFKIAFDDKKFTQYFLSMREFKCIEGEDLLCHVPYPYPSPGRASPNDLSWLEHALIFFYKRPNDYGANMANGLLYTLKLTPEGLVGTPQSIDLNEIAIPPDDRSVAYYSAAHRYDIEPGARWIVSLTMENHR
jgi:hypothetical protein